MKKEECVKMLRDNEAFKVVLNQAKDDKERRFIKSYAEDFVMKFYDSIFAPMQKIQQENPSAVKEALEVLLREETCKKDPPNDGDEK